MHGIRRGSIWALAACFAALAPAATARDAAPPATTARVYWIAAVPVTWNVVPNERDAIGGKTYTPDQTTFETVVYKRYSPHWRHMLRDDPLVSADNDGIPGPLIRARVGDHIVVHFKNLDSAFKRPHSMHFHGVHYHPGSDGAYVPGFSGPGANVKPGQSFTYKLFAGADSAGVWPYHDHSPSMDDSIAGGLYGALSILGTHEAPPDREFVVFFETQLDFMTINGRAFLGDTPVFHARVGDVVQWDVLALGDAHHTFHIHGHRWRQADGSVIDTRTIGPAESFSLRFKEDDPGAWLYHCHVEEHMGKGMIGLYRVAPR